MTGNETLKNIKQRRSIRSYRDEQIKDEELESILEAGRYAPNAGGESWHFTVVQDRRLLERLKLAAKAAARMTEINGLKDLGNNETFDCLYGAPTLIIVSACEKAPVPMDADCAAANQNMLLAAESLGLGSCWIYFVLMAFQSEEGPVLRKELKMPDGYRPYCSAVFGYKADSAVEVAERESEVVTYVR